MVFHEITRARHPRGRREPARSRPRPRRRPGDPPHPRPALRLRGLAGAVEEGHAEAVGRPGAVGGHADHRAARARADGVRRRAATGTSPRLLDAGCASATPQHVPGARSSPSTAAAWPPAATSARTAQAARRRRACSTRAARAAWPRPCRAATCAVTSVESKPYTRKPYAPFMTSTLQQEAGRKLRFSAERTMRARPAAVRERLHHLHAYRLDHAVGVGDQTPPAPGPRAVRRRRTCPRPPRQYTRKVKNAQEAHEAIRPAGETFRTPGAGARTSVDGDEFRLYELIWQRTVASQMADARGTTRQRADHRAPPAPARSACSPRPGARSPSPASSRPTSRPSTTEAGGEADDAERRLPELTAGPGADTPSS